MFSNQRSQGQAVSTSKHGRVCAQGCRHRPRTPGEGTSGQDPKRCHWANKSRFGEPQATTGGVPPSRPPREQLPSCPNKSRLRSAQAGSPPQIKVIGRGLKASGGRMRGHVLALPAESPAVVFHSRIDFRGQDLLAQLVQGKMNFEITV